MSFHKATVVRTEANPETYHARLHARGSAEFAMSPSHLKEFARCPSRWFNGYEPPGSEAMEWGSLLDCLLLTPGQFNSRYAVIPSDAPKKPSKSQLNAKKPSADTLLAISWWKDFNVSHPDCEIISADLLADCKAAINRLRSDDVAAAFIDASDKQVLVQAEWHDEHTGLVVPVRCLMDLVPRLETEFAKCLGDLKTGRSAALVPFQRQCFELSWHVQAAFDTDLYVAATGEDRNSWCFLVQENFKPWQPGKRLLSQAFLELGRVTYRRQLANYCLCLKTGVWPGYDDTDEAIQGWSLCEAEPFMESAATFAPKFLFGGTPEESPSSEPEEVIP